MTLRKVVRWLLNFVKSSPEKGSGDSYIETRPENIIVAGDKIQINEQGLPLPYKSIFHIHDVILGIAIIHDDVGKEYEIPIDKLKKL